MPNQIFINAVLQANAAAFENYLTANLNAVNWDYFDTIRPNLRNCFDSVESHDRTNHGGGTNLAKIDNETIFHRSPGANEHTGTIFFQEPNRGSHIYRIIAIGLHTSATPEGRTLRGDAVRNSYRIVWRDTNIVPTDHALRNNIITLT